jgi:hypothetical protein
MPFASKAQSRLMHAVANNPKLAKQLGIQQSDAKKMVKDAQHGKGSMKKLPEMVKKK